MIGVSTVLIIGAGGVGNVAAHKCAQQPEVFSRIVLASRTRTRCEEVAKSIKNRYGTEIITDRVDAGNVSDLIRLIRREGPSIVINVALPYQDLTIMDACTETGVSYIDTANYEPPEMARFEYGWQWDYHDKFKDIGITAILGCGFDPGVTNAYCAYARDYLFDSIKTIDIVDCNAGEHGHPFATNFNPEINIREITQKGKYWENGNWIEIDPMSVSTDIDFPGIGTRKAYLLYHEEEESLVRYIPDLRRIRFWMTFSEEYLMHLQVLKNVGMTGIEPVDYDGKKIIPLKFLKAVLPDPAELSLNYTGKTCIGCIITGISAGREKTVMIYNICDHTASHAEVGAQAVSYTAGVPPVAAAEMFLRGIWKRPGVWNVEQFDPKPFLDLIGDRGLPWNISEEITPI